MVRVQTADFNAGQEIRELRAGGPAIGAIAVFVGLVRDFSEDVDVLAMHLEHYPGMTEKSLEAIVAEARRRWPIHEARVIHRVGDFRPGDQLVLVAVSGGHRGEAFEACAFIMDYLKTRAPFWKKERTARGDRWVGAKAADAEAAGRWQK